jgi:hypothetical protein
MSQEMRSDFDGILRVAMRLSPEARAALAVSLLESVDKTFDQKTEATWEMEVARRTHELDSDVAKPVAWFVTSTVAPGTTLPLVSETTPAICPVACAPASGDHHASPSTQARATTVCFTR